MDYSLVIAVVGTGIAIVGAVISMMFWARTEANDIRKEQKEDRKDLLKILGDIRDDMKDFHYRLLEIERGRK